mmetsp:Transcript_40257/g.96462  ORF Transcript_40257/g.96462 Transcript_40257/m.96462 type:complete len:215 (-) Transcript_40257:522-1166(-)
MQSFPHIRTSNPRISISKAVPLEATVHPCELRSCSGRVMNTGSQKSPKPQACFPCTSEKILSIAAVVVDVVNVVGANLPVHLRQQLLALRRQRSMTRLGTAEGTRIIVSTALVLLWKLARLGNVLVQLRRVQTLSEKQVHIDLIFAGPVASNTRGSASPARVAKSDTLQIQRCIEGSSVDNVMSNVGTILAEVRLSREIQAVGCKLWESLEECN